MRPPGFIWSARRSTQCYVLILAVTLVAVMLRAPRLRQRPMHTDEAVHAEKFRLLLEEGTYTYDPNEYHGPTLNYLTLIPAWLTSAQKLTEITEFTLRIVPVFFGLVLIVLLVPAARGLGLGAATCAALLAAVSPAMVFYSRYYIQETLLVCFTFGVIVTGYRYAQGRNVLWILLTGVFLGLMHASKETCVVAVGSMALALLLAHRLGPALAVVKATRRSDLVICLAAAALVSALFHSSFLSNPSGVVDSARTYLTYVDRAGSNDVHIHPWYYYLKMLVCFKSGDGPFWSEGLIVLLAAVGFVVALRAKGSAGTSCALVRFVAFYTLMMTVIYSAIPYKTPWCVLGFLHGMILLAGVGAVALIGWAPKGLPRLVTLGLLTAGLVHLIWQSYLCNYVYYADNRNPYVYAHTTEDVFHVVERVEEMAMAHPDGHRMHVQVICPKHDYWPLPWYLRHFEKDSIDWLDQVVDGQPSAPLIIASDKVEAALSNKLYTSTPLENRQLYLYLFEQRPYYMWLRPKVKLFGFVRKDLWESAQRVTRPTTRPETKEVK
ncbi:MAG: TIGR03663 family protein [Phycisphaerales bacterium]|nr:MAG: TIGR03663 family protein [Phycisphaerales bacterium]